MYYLQSRYYDPAIGRFINADAYTSTGQGLLGNNMFAYCLNNPVNSIDPSGQFPWLIVGVIVTALFIGGALGYMSEEKLGPSGSEPEHNIKQNPMFYREVDPNPQDRPDFLPTEDNLEKELTTGDRIRNTIIGAGLGLAVGGAIVATIGAGAAVIAGSASTTIPLFGATGAQTFAIGAVVYNFFAMMANAFFGLEVETVETVETIDRVP